MVGTWFSLRYVPALAWLCPQPSSAPWACPRNTISVCISLSVKPLLFTLLSVAHCQLTSPTFCILGSPLRNLALLCLVFMPSHLFLLWWLTCSHPPNCDLKSLGPPSSHMLGSSHSKELINIRCVMMIFRITPLPLSYPCAFNKLLLAW